MKPAVTDTAEPTTAAPVEPVAAGCFCEQRGHRHHTAAAADGRPRAGEGVEAGVEEDVEAPAPLVEGIVDLHVHSAPSIVPRHHTDPDLPALARASGIATLVLKAHEGTTAERAQLMGDVAVGSVVLNSTVGGANPDAVEVAARLGARVVWMPTVSAPAHQRAARSAELQAHRGVQLRTVEVRVDGRLRPEWNEVLDVVARHDLVLASGHLDMDETVTLFTEARARGVQRLVVTHPMLEFLGWRSDHAARLEALGAHLEVGVLADLLAGPEGELTATAHLAEVYPAELLVFGSDLGHRDYPGLVPGLNGWIRRAMPAVGEKAVVRLMTDSGRELLAP